MDSLLNWIIEHAGHAHWIIFVGIILAGFNIPISIDILVISGAILAATVIPENTWLLYLSIFLGSSISAYVAYWLGRLVGPALLKWRYFAKLLPPHRLSRVQTFYEKYGLLTLILGRFIPFGVRNAIFFSTGMSKVSFPKFIFRDFLACFIWTAVSFSVFYALGHSYETIKHFLQSFYIFVLAAFGVTVIGFIWYKKRKKPAKESSP